uniref:Alpha/beta hydrolase fold-3 domain-containing protein n=2 Tax=Zosterops TaxID=36298 RepID=A0A8D2NXN9_ZOSLA
MAVGQITYVKFFQELTIHEVKTAWKSKVYKYIQCSTGTKGNTKRCVRPPRTPFSIFKTKMISIATFLDKVGIASEVHVLRVIMDTIPPLKDKRLLIKDLRFERVKVRIYQPKTSNNSQRRGILYLHGGVGRELFCFIGAYERTCRYLCRKTNSVVVSVGYRLAPEHPFPAQFEDCLTAAIHFLRTAQDHGVDPSRVVICGDSSGGTLAAAVAQALANRRDLPKLRAQILIYPFLQCVDLNLPSYQQNKRVPILLKERTLILGLKYINKDLKYIEEIFKGSHVSEDQRLKYQKWVSPDYIPHEFKIRGYRPSPKYLPLKEMYEVAESMFDPVFSPLLAEDNVIAQLPETFLLTCEFDVLRDDGLLYKKRLEDHGIKVTWCHLQEGFHGTVFLAFFGGILRFRSGTKGVEKIVNFLRLM